MRLKPQNSEMRALGHPKVQQVSNIVTQKVLEANRNTYNIQLEHTPRKTSYYKSIKKRIQKKNKTEVKY